MVYTVSGVRDSGRNGVLTSHISNRLLPARPAGETLQPGVDGYAITGDINVIDRGHFELMKDGAIVANSGHFDVEIDIRRLREIASGEPREVRPEAVEYVVDGRRIVLLAEGRLINLAAAEGHPASVMDMSFANQALSAEYMVKNADKLKNTVYSVPDDIDKEIARLKLESMGVQIDVLTEEQIAYLNSWQEGT